MVICEDDTAPGFIFAPKHSRRHTAKVLIDTDFADDIVLLTINQTQGLLYKVESTCNSVALHFNSHKNKSMLHSELIAPLSKQYLIRVNQLPVSPICMPSLSKTTLN